MAHTFDDLLIHVIFSTKNRLPLINEELRLRLFPYMGGIVRELGGSAISIGGTSNHVHLLLRLPASVALASTVRVLKTNSTRWVHDTFAGEQPFGWQIGYAAFTVSRSNMPAVMRYIEDQPRHHARASFEDEFIAFLRKCEIDFDNRFVFD